MMGNVEVQIPRKHIPNILDDDTVSMGRAVHFPNQVDLLKGICLHMDLNNTYLNHNKNAMMDHG